MDSDRYSLIQAIRNEGHRLGFSLVGVTSADPPPHLAAYLDWLDAGRQGEMDYLGTERARQRRADPQQILPGCRSILVVALPYPPTNKMGSQASQELRGQVAAYAWGKDYHLIFQERLQALVDFLHQTIKEDFAAKIYSDTGPILERDLAQRAGLGWIGKNTCLISPTQGSFFLLGEVLTTLDLPVDEPFTADRCGSCTRCIDACPTSCILPDRTLDARRCISYLTIEKKGPIPVDLRPQMGDWVFGCDVCQAVCPWNERFARSIFDPELTPRLEVATPDLRREIQLTPQEFKQKFKENPVLRARRRGYLRNASVALGNQNDPTTLPALVEVLAHESEPLVRGHAAWAVGQIKSPESRKILERCLETETDEWVREEIKQALEELAQGS